MSIRSILRVKLLNQFYKQSHQKEEVGDLLSRRKKYDDAELLELLELK